MALDWDRTYNILQTELSRKPTCEEVQVRLSEMRKMCIGCLFDKPLKEFDGEFCKQCKSEAEAAGIKL